VKKISISIIASVISMMLAGVFLLSSCGVGEPIAQEPIMEEPAVEEPSVEEPVVEETPGEIVNIRHWEMMNGPEDLFVPAVQKLAQQFNDEHPNINVSVEMINWDGYYETFLTAVLGGVAPDSSTGAFPQAFQYAEMGEALDLSPIIEEWQQEGVDLDQEFGEGWLELLQHNGAQVGIPWTIHANMWGYRTDIFEQVGATEPPGTWEEFLSVCRAIKAETDLVPIALPGAHPWAYHIMMNLLFNNGVGFVDENLNANFTDPRVIETLEFIEILYREELITPAAAGLTHGEAVNIYTSGDAAVVWDPNREVFFDFPGISENTEVLPSFAGPNGQPSNLTWIDNVMAYSQTDHPEATRTWVKYWLDNNIIFWHEGGLFGLPARTSFMNDEFFETRYHQEIINKALPNSVVPTFPAESIFTGYPQVEGEGYPSIALQEVLTGNTDFESIAQEVNELIEQVLE
jgi:multiple sugar transport system substrate-binding protein